MPDPFTIEIPDSEVRDLRLRLAQTRWPSEVTGSGWQYGSNLAYVQELCEYWRTEFDWPAQQARLNRMPQFKTQVSADGIEDYTVHFVLAGGRWAGSAASGLHARLAWIVLRGVEDPGAADRSRCAYGGIRPMRLRLLLRRCRDTGSRRYRAAGDSGICGRLACGWR